MIKRVYHLTYTVYDTDLRKVGFGFRHFELTSWRDTSVLHVRDVILPDLERIHTNKNIMIQTINRV